MSTVSNVTVTNVYAAGEAGGLPIPDIVVTVASVDNVHTLNIVHTVYTLDIVHSVRSVHNVLNFRYVEAAGCAGGLDITVDIVDTVDNVKSGQCQQCP